MYMTALFSLWHHIDPSPARVFVATLSKFTSSQVCLAVCYPVSGWTCMYVCGAKRSTSPCLYCHVDLFYHTLALFVSTCQASTYFSFFLSSVMLLHLFPSMTRVSLHDQSCRLVLSCVSLVFRSLSLLLTVHWLGYICFPTVCLFCFFFILISIFHTCGPAH